MLRRYLAIESPATVPYTDGRYTVTHSGLIWDAVDECRIVPSQNNLVEIFITGIKEKVTVAWVVAVTYKSMKGGEVFLLKWSLLFSDGDKNNVHPSNLIWKPPRGGQPSPNNPGFYVIPGYSNYIVDRDGNVKTWDGEDVRVGNISGYEVFYPDLYNGKTSIIGVHRALALAFLEYSETVTGMTVNHLDGVKDNNSLTNLEWASYSRNNRHALENGLRDVYRAVSVKDHWTDNVIVYRSLTGCAEALGKNSGQIYTYAVVYPHLVLDHRYTVRLVDDQLEHPSLDKDELRNNKERQEIRSQELECCATCIFTGKTYVAPGPGYLGRILKLTKDQVSTALESTSKYPAHGYVFQFMNSLRKIRTFDDDEKEFFKENVTLFRAFKVTEPDGYSVLLPSINDLVDYFGVKRGRFYHTLSVLKKDSFEFEGRLIQRIPDSFTT